MHELLTRDFYCQLKANDMDLRTALNKLESLIFDETLNAAAPYRLKKLPRQKLTTPHRNCLSHSCSASHPWQQFYNGRSYIV
jgi:hypothetical protein